MGFGRRSTFATLYDEETKGKRPFWIEKLTPIQIATFNLDEYRRVRAEFTTNEWLDLLIRSMGYEPIEMSRRLKLQFLLRLIPLTERNYNLIELGPRGLGRPTSFRRSRYAALLTGGTTVANLFGHMNGKQKGMVQIWDVVGVDDVADLQDAEGSHHDDEDLRRVRHVTTWPSERVG